MGMSASQARLIALTARMSDVEYEGQQINQQRLTLTNKMSEVYEQMTNMDVPTPPSMIDYAYDKFAGKVGGTNVNVKYGDDGNLVATQTVKGAVVNTTKGTVGGAMKIKLQNFDGAVAKAATDGNFEAVEEGTTPEFYVSTTTIKVADKSQLYVPKEGLQYLNENQAHDEYGKNKAGWYDPDTGGIADEPFTQATAITNGTEYFTSSGELYGTAGTDFVDKDSVVAAFSGDANSGFTKLESLSHNQEVHVGYTALPNDEPCVAVADAKDTAIGLSEAEVNNLYVVNEKDNSAVKINVKDYFDGPNEDGKYTLKSEFFDVQFKKEGGNEEFIDAAKTGDTVTDASGNVGTLLKNDDGKPMSISEAIDKFPNDSKLQAAITALRNSLKASSAQESDYSIVSMGDGNYAFVEEKDRTDGDRNINLYVPGTGEYEEELPEGYTITYDKNGNVNGITLKNGMSGSLNTTQGYDEIAYGSAMATYTAEKAQYDREQNELNKKTSIYQRQDKQLELKLKRLDTERNALNTEIDAVKKVIQDATDKGFKTFSG